MPHPQLLVSERSGLDRLCVTALPCCLFQYIGELEDIPTSADMSGRGYLLTQLDAQRVHRSTLVDHMTSHDVMWLSCVEYIRYYSKSKYNTHSIYNSFTAEPWPVAMETGFWTQCHPHSLRLQRKDCQGWQKSGGWCVFSCNHGNNHDSRIDLPTHAHYEWHHIGVYMYS